MKIHALRLRPGQDLRLELERFIKLNNIHSGIILTCVGSLVKATLRMADESTTKTFTNKYEIVSLVGTIAGLDVHLHIALSDEQGQTIGGHLKEGCVVRTTAEVVIGEIDEFKLTREFDKETGFDELKVKSNHTN